MTGMLRKLVVAGLVVIVGSIKAGAEPAVPYCFDEITRKHNYVYNRFHNTMPRFLQFSDSDMQDSQSVFTDCSAGWKLTVVNENELALDILDRLLYSNVVYTRSQIRKILRESGYKTRITNFLRNHCSCSLDMTVDMNDTVFEMTE